MSGSWQVVQAGDQRSVDARRAAGQSNVFSIQCRDFTGKQISHSSRAVSWFCVVVKHEFGAKKASEKSPNNFLGKLLHRSDVSRAFRMDFLSSSPVPGISSYFFQIRSRMGSAQAGSASQYFSLLTGHSLSMHSVFICVELRLHFLIPRMSFCRERSADNVLTRGKK